MGLFTEKYDRILWRINGLILLLAGIGLLFGMLYIGVMILRDFGRNHRRPDLVTVDQATQKKEFLRLGYGRPLAGGQYVLIPLTTSSDGSTSFSYKGTRSGDEKNYLVVNKIDKTLSWVWSDSKISILRSEVVHKEISNDKPIAKGLWIQVVSKDRDQNEKLEEEDGIDLLYYDLASQEKAPILENLDRVASIEQINADELMILFIREGSGYWTTFNARTNKTSSESPINIPL